MGTIRVMGVISANIVGIIKMRNIGIIYDLLTQGPGKLVVIDVNPRRSPEASRSDGCI
jgi:hypothetical protein